MKQSVHRPMPMKLAKKNNMQCNVFPNRNVMECFWNVFYRFSGCIQQFVFQQVAKLQNSEKHVFQLYDVFDLGQKHLAAFERDSNIILA